MVGTVASMGPKQVTCILRPSISMSLIRAVEVGSSVMADGDEVLVDERVSGADAAVGSPELVVDAPGSSVQAVSASARAAATAADVRLDMVFLPAVGLSPESLPRGSRQQ